MMVPCQPSPQFDALAGVVVEPREFYVQKASGGGG